MNRTCARHLLAVVGALVFAGCSTPEASPDTPTTATGDLSCDEVLAAFAPYRDLADASCDDGTLSIASVGLPETDPADERDRAMVGITSWIQRVAIPYAMDWRLPRNPEWLDDYGHTSGIGPIAVAVDGVPIFHYEARPDPEIDPTRYDPRSDTVVQGELDQCGGHSGQGEDYHYHYAPVCLLSKQDLSKPIAFSLDGAPIYYGTGGTDYYGRGRYTDWNELPGGSTESLDLCNAYRFDDGSFAYFTTASPPYVLGCHRATFDRSRQINVPFRGRPQGSPVPFGTTAGEPVATNVTAWSEADGVWRLEFDAYTGATEGTAAVEYEQTDAARDCWAFTFFERASDATGVTETYCR